MRFTLEQIHDEYGWHEKQIKRSESCGCFHCIEVFQASVIEEWIDEPKDCPRGPGRTAVCPYCGIDAVLPENENYQLSKDLLESMHSRYF